MKRTSHNRIAPYVYRILVIALIFPAVFVSVFLGVMLIPLRSPERFTIVVASSPIQIITINTQERTASVVKIPEDYAIRGAFAMGTYSIASFWKMGSLDVHDRSLLSNSMQISLGVPLDGFIGYSYEELFDDQSQQSDILKEQFTLAGLLAYITGQRVTDLSLFELIQLYKSAKSIRQSDIKHIDLGKSMSTTDEELPDGSIQARLDHERTDAILKNVFVYPAIRKEALTIGVSNAAGIPELAAGISRQLTHTGMFVVSVSSDDVQKQQCEITGSDSNLNTKTAEFIVSRYHCKKNISAQSQREDLVMHLGSDIGSLYVPRGKK